MLLHCMIDLFVLCIPPTVAASRDSPLPHRTERDKSSKHRGRACYLLCAWNIRVPISDSIRGQSDSLALAARHRGLQRGRARQTRLAWLMRCPSQGHISILLVTALLIIDVLLSSECSLLNDIMDRPHTMFKNLVVRRLVYIFWLLQEIALFCI